MRRPHGNQQECCIHELFEEQVGIVSLLRRGGVQMKAVFKV